MGGCSSSDDMEINEEFSVRQKNAGLLVKAIRALDEQLHLNLNDCLDMAGSSGKLFQCYTGVVAKAFQRGIRCIPDEEMGAVGLTEDSRMQAESTLTITKRLAAKSTSYSSSASTGQTIVGSANYLSNAAQECSEIHDDLLRKWRRVNELCKEVTKAFQECNRLNRKVNRIESGKQSELETLNQELGEAMKAYRAVLAQFDSFYETTATETMKQTEQSCIKWNLAVISFWRSLADALDSSKTSGGKTLKEGGSTVKSSPSSSAIKLPPSVIGPSPTKKDVESVKLKYIDQSATNRPSEEANVDPPTVPPTVRGD